MSFVGPRPNVSSDVDLYTKYEQTLLNVLPGITDPSSIIFSNEGDILRDSTDPDHDYNVLIRPWKNIFALRYLHIRTIYTDIFVCVLTFTASLNLSLSLKLLARILKLDTKSVAYSVATRSINLSLASSNPPNSFEDVISL